MRLSECRKILGIALALIAVPSLGAVLALWARPPDLLRIGANYTAKIVCSNVFLAARDPQQVLQNDVQAPGASILKLMRVSVDLERGVVRAGLFGFIGNGLAQLQPGVGCSVRPDGVLAPFAPSAGSPGAYAAAGDGLWPDGEAVEIAPSVARVVNDDALAGVGMRSIVVVHRGRVVAERYADGFGMRTPQLGWSMTKTVTAALIGILVKDGLTTLDHSAVWPASDGRGGITVADLLSMTSGLRFNEEYGAVSDVTRMLYLEPDMAAFAQAQPLEHAIGAVWSYSSGTAVILARLFQDVAGADAVAMARRRLFGPLGMTTAVMETDERGTLVGSSSMYASPRDWARYGQLLAQGGVWQGREILPRGFVAMMSSPVQASGGEYGRGLVWRWASHADRSFENPDAPFHIPADAFWMLGHDGQFVVVVPSRELVVVRMGLTPSRLGYHPQPLVSALLEAVQ